MTKIYWRCEICGALRPDASISVATHDISKKHDLPKGTVQQNVKHCNDVDDCREAAEKPR